MSIDQAMPRNANDPTTVYPQQQYYYEAPAGLGYGPGFPPAFPGPPPPAPPAGGRRRTGLIVALVGVLVLAVAGVGAFILILAHRTVDPVTVEQEITRITEQNERVAPTGIQCPTGVPMEKGSTFTCSATLLNRPVTYTVTLTDDQGAVTINYIRPVLDKAKVEQEIVRSTRAETGVQVDDVQCPAEVRFEKGGVFTCAAVFQAQPLTYQITQTDDNGAIRIAHERLVSAKDVDAELARQLTKEVGEPIVARCAQDGQTMIVNEVGTPITCQAANAANPARNAKVTVQVDAQGNLTYQF